MEGDGVFSQRYCAVIATTCVDGTEMILVGVQKRSARKFLTDFGGYPAEGAVPSRAAISLFVQGTLGLLGNDKSLLKQVKVPQRFRVPGLGYVWRVQVPPALVQVIQEQFATVSSFLQKYHNIESQFCQVQFMAYRDLLLGPAAKRASPSLLNIARHTTLIDPHAAASCQPGEPPCDDEDEALEAQSSPQCDEDDHQ